MMPRWKVAPEVKEHNNLITDKVMSNLEWLGDRYYRDHLGSYDVDELLQNPQVGSMVRYGIGVFSAGRI